MPTATSSLPKRVNFLISERAHGELVRLAKESNRSITDILRLGLGLAKLALEAERSSNRLIVTTSDGQPLKEIVLPPS